MKLLSLFSGIGAFEKALDRMKINYELVNFCEFDKYAVKSYCAIHNVDESKNLGDITKIDKKSLDKNIDLLTYGFPCQDISVAGKSKGLFNEDGTKTRSGLFFDALEIIEETKPRIAIAENVKNLTSKRFKEQFEIVLQSLEDAGYNNYWQVLNAKDHGIPQNRERVFIVSIRKDIDTGEFEFPKPFELELRLKDVLEDVVAEKFYLSEKATEKITLNSNNSRNNFGELKQVGQIYGTEREPNPQAGRVYSAEGISPAMDTCSGGNRMPKVLIPQATKQGFAKSKTRRGRVQEGGTICPTITAESNGLCRIEEPIIVASRGRNPQDPSDRTAGSPTEQRLEPNVRGLCNTLTSVQKDNLVLEPSNIIIDNTQGFDGTRAYNRYCPTLRAGRSGLKTVGGSLRIRRLTPRECWRLMGFDDTDFDKAEKVCSNTQLYKQAGNSIVVNVLEELFNCIPNDVLSV